MWRAAGPAHACEGLRKGPAHACEGFGNGRCWVVKVYDVDTNGQVSFSFLFMGMDILTKEGRIPSELVPLAIAWGQGVAADIEALFYPPTREEPPEGGPAQM